MSKAFGSLSSGFVESFGRELYHCSSCNYCVDAVWPQRGILHVCATMEHHTRAPGYSGRGFIEAARAVFEGAALDAEALAKRVFTCTTCGNCESVCPIGLHPAQIGHALRQELVDADCVPEAVAAARAAIVRDANPYGAPRSERATWAAGLPDAAPNCAGPAYFAGCAAAVAAPGEARAGYDLMCAAGAQPAPAPSACCGAAMAELGFAREAAALAAATAAALESMPGQPVVAGYECQRHLAQAAGQQIANVAGWLLQACRSGAIELKLAADTGSPLRVHLLETCQLKRSARAAAATDEDAAAALFAALGIEAANAAYPSAHALCCGAAGGMPRMQPDASARMARARLPAAGIVVTLDPRCAAHLRQASQGMPVQVYGFAEFIRRHCVVTPQDSTLVPDPASAR
jgi:Fe-S oxidoreductase